MLLRKLNPYDLYLADVSFNSSELVNMLPIWAEMLRHDNQALPSITSFCLKQFLEDTLSVPHEADLLLPGFQNITDLKLETSRMQSSFPAVVDFVAKLPLATLELVLDVCLSRGTINYIQAMLTRFNGSLIITIKVKALQIAEQVSMTIDSLIQDKWGDQALSSKERDNLPLRKAGGHLGLEDALNTNSKNSIKLKTLQSLNLNSNIPKSDPHAPDAGGTLSRWIADSANFENRVDIEAFGKQKRLKEVDLSGIDLNASASSLIKVLDIGKGSSN
ncbi:hypothetical protein BC829DRAFT_445282 [Chytridium lagenaria]|nr:hypothetical protein BC829DRAFT_445282 [Chytridium lagenaria]